MSAYYFSQFKRVLVREVLGIPENTRKDNYFEDLIKVYQMFLKEESDLLKEKLSNYCSLVLVKEDNSLDLEACTRLIEITGTRINKIVPEIEDYFSGCITTEKGKIYFQ